MSRRVEGVFKIVFAVRVSRKLTRRIRMMMEKVMRKVTMKTMRKLADLSMRALDSPSTITLYCDMSSGQPGGSDLGCQ